MFRRTRRRNNLRRRLFETYYSPYGGEFEQRHFAGRRGNQTSYGDVVNKDYQKFYLAFEKVIKRYISSGDYDELLHGYNPEDLTRGELLEASMMTLRDITSWIKDVDELYEKKSEEVTDAYYRDGIENTIVEFRRYNDPDYDPFDDDTLFDYDSYTKEEQEAVDDDIREWANDTDYLDDMAALEQDVDD